MVCPDSAAVEPDPRGDVVLVVVLGRDRLAGDGRSEEVTSLDIGRTGSSEPSPYGGVPEGFMLLYFAAVTLLVILAMLSQRACPGRREFERSVLDCQLPRRAPFVLPPCAPDTGPGKFWSPS